MSTKELDDIIRRAELLTADEKLQLAAILIERARRVAEAGSRQVLWGDLRGLVPEPALGEDVQAWVTRTRQEGANGEGH